MAGYQPVTEDGASYDMNVAAAGSYLDAMQHPAVVGGGGGCSILAGVDPRHEGSWWRLPGFRRISTTMGNSRIKGSEVGLADSADVSVDFFKAITVTYGSRPYERRGFVVSANNMLIFKYYDTLTSTWAVRTLVSDLDTQFGTRSNFDVATRGKFLYVSRCGLSSTDLGKAETPMVFWWETSEWQHFATGFLPLAAVRCLTIYNGRLYAGGDFTAINGRQCRYLAVWNGRFWEEFLGGTDAPVRIVYATPIANGTEKYLVIGGAFTKVDPDGVNLTVGRIAYTEGSVWQTFGDGFADGQVRALQLCNVNGGANTYFFAGGTFTTANAGGATTVNRVSYWDSGGSTWVAMGATPGCNGTVEALIGWNNLVYIGGAFSLANAVANTVRIATWSGSVFAAVGRGITSAASQVSCFVLGDIGSGTKLFIGGVFTQATQSGGSTLACSSVVSWDGTNYADLNGGLATGVSSAQVATMALIRIAAGGTTALVAGGDFTKCNGTSNNALHIAIYNNSTWSAMGSGITNVGTGTTPFVKSIIRDDLSAGYGTVLVGGSFVAAGSPAVTLNSVGRFIYGAGDLVASVGARQWDEWAPITLKDAGAVTSGATAPGAFTADCYYGVMVTLADHGRGMQTPPSEVAVFEKTGGGEDLQELINIYVATGARTVSYPRTLRVWRTIGFPTDENTIDDVKGGPFYLEYEVVYDPLNGSPTQFMVGALSDTALAAQISYNNANETPGATSDGPTMALYKNVMFTLAGGWKPAGSLSEGESYNDMRWSPPWQETPEYTVVGVSYRTRAAIGDAPRFTEAGDFLIFHSRNSLIRIQVQSGYMIPVDGPTGFGVCNREAIAAVGGDVYFITPGAEMIKMNVATGSWQVVPHFTRLLKTRWRPHVRAGRMNVIHDPQSNLLMVFPYHTTPQTPVDGIVMHCGNYKCAWMFDLYIKFGSSGAGVVDPETGRPSSFVITQTGVILSPDWEERGAWLNDGTWGTNSFYTTVGATGTINATPTAITSLTSPSRYQIDCTGASFDLDSTFGMLKHCMVYVSRDYVNANGETDTSRRQIVGRFTLYAVVDADTITVYRTGVPNGTFGGLNLVNFASWSNVRIHIAPVVVAAAVEVPRSLQMPSLQDRAAVPAMSVVAGRVGDGSKTSPSSTDDFVVMGTIPIERDGWAIDSPTLVGAVVPMTTGSEAQPAGSPISVNPDNMNCPVVNPPSHQNVPIIMSVSNDLFFELLGVRVQANIDQGLSGLSSA